MGSAASISGDEITKAQAQELAGDLWNEESEAVWSEKSMLGTISKEDWEDITFAASIKRIFLAELETEIDRVCSSGKTPLVLCPLEEGEGTSKVDTYFGYSKHAPHIIEGKKLIKDIYVSKSVTMEDARSELRSTLVNAMMENPPHNPDGRMLMIRLANSACDFNSICDENTFPLEVFDPSLISTEAVWSKFVTDEDKARTFGMFTVGSDFRVVITSDFAPEDATSFLKGSIPLSAGGPIEVICVKPGAPPKPPPQPQRGDLVAYNEDVGSETIICTMLAFQPDGEKCNIKFVDGKIKEVSAESVSFAPEGSELPPAPEPEPEPPEQSQGSKKNTKNATKGKKPNVHGTAKKKKNKPAKK